MACDVLLAKLRGRYALSDVDEASFREQDIDYIIVTVSVSESESKSESKSKSKSKYNRKKQRQETQLDVKEIERLTNEMRNAVTAVNVAKMAVVDYLNKRQFRITTTADPRRDITIRFKNRTYARGLMTKSYPLWKSDPLAAAELKEPFYFRMTNVAASTFTLQGIVFTEAEYSRDLDRHIILFNENMRENDMKPIYRLQRAYVVKMQQCTHVIVFLYHKPIKEKMLMSRANLQERLSDEEREKKEKESSDQLVQSYIHRFYRI